MLDFCDCDEWSNLKKLNAELFYKDDSYGWVLSWVKLTKEKGYTQVHRYGVPINFCPMCGAKLGSV